MRILLVLVLTCAAAWAQLRPISKQELRDKIEGGWAGRMIGASFAAPWTPDRVAAAVKNKDLYANMALALVLDELGLGASTAEFEKASASIKEVQFDFIGLMAPGMPRGAAELARRVGRVKKDGRGTTEGIFTACMYASAYFEADTRRIVEAGLGCLPARSPEARAVRDVLAWASRYPRDVRKTQRLAAQKHRGRRVVALAIALLYGRGDLGQTLNLSPRAGGILGVVIGYKRIPAQWKSGFPAIAGVRFPNTEYSFRTIVDSTEYRAGAFTKRHGGKVEDQRLLVRKQRPRPS